VPSVPAPSAVSTEASPVAPTRASTPGATFERPATQPVDAASTLLTEPAVIERIPLEAGQQGESVGAGGGRVWVGTTGGAVIEFDAASGAPLRSYSLAHGSPANPTPVEALAYDGARVWALLRFTTQGTQYKTLAVLDPASGETLHQFDVSASDPRHLGFQSGQIWLQNAVYDTTTYQSKALDMPTDASVFAYDGAGMWVGGAATTCDTCQQMLYRYAGGTLNPGPAASQQVLGLAVAAERLWVLTGFNQLDGYPLGNALGAETQPAARVDLAPDHDFPPAQILYDGARLWLLGSIGKGSGRVFWHDPRSGKKLGGLVVGDSSEAPLNASIPVAMAYDGKNLWVLTALHLVRVGLPQ
jgi:hypothetical protein